MGAVAFFDIDGTLIDPVKRSESEQKGLPAMPTDRVMHAIASFRKAGNYAFVCSGRPYPAIAESGLPDLFDGCIAFAGAYVTAFGAVVRDERLPESLVIKLVDLFIANGISVLCESPQGYALLPGGRVPWPFPEKDVYGSFEQLRALSTDLDFRKFVFSEKAESILLDAIKVCFGDELTCLNISMGLCEVTARGFNKAAGIRAVLGVLKNKGASVDRVFAFGDSANDRMMFETADVSIAMGNALPEILENADYVTDDVTHDGVATALEHFHLC